MDLVEKNKILLEDTILNDQLLTTKRQRQGKRIKTFELSPLVDYYMIVY